MRVSIYIRHTERQLFFRANKCLKKYQKIKIILDFEWAEEYIGFTIMCIDDINRTDLYK